MTWYSDQRNQQKKVQWERYYSFLKQKRFKKIAEGEGDGIESRLAFKIFSTLLSCPHEHGHLWQFFTIQSQGIEQTTTLDFTLKVLWQQKMTSITPSIYEIIHLKVFSNILLRNLNHFQGPVHLELFCSFASEVLGLSRILAS